MVEKQTDVVEHTLRFGCGFSFGIVVSAAGLWWLWWGEVATLLIAMCIAGLVFGALAICLGELLWDWLAEHSKWWSWL
jgi:hypothetical protein